MGSKQKTVLAGADAFQTPGGIPPSANPLPPPPGPPPGVAEAGIELHHMLMMCYTCTS